MEPDQERVELFRALEVKEVEERGQRRTMYWWCYSMDHWPYYP